MPKLRRGKIIRPIAILLNCIVLFAYGAAFVLFMAAEDAIGLLEPIMPPENYTIPVLAILAASTPLCSLVALLRTGDKD